MNLLLSNSSDILPMSIIDNWSDNVCFDTMDQTAGVAGWADQQTGWYVHHCHDLLSGNDVVIDDWIIDILIYRVSLYVISLLHTFLNQDLKISVFNGHPVLIKQRISVPSNSIKLMKYQTDSYSSLFLGTSEQSVRCTRFVWLGSWTL